MPRGLNTFDDRQTMFVSRRVMKHRAISSAIFNNVVSENELETFNC